MKFRLLTLVALLVIAMLPLQGVTTAMQRLSTPAHYHLVASVTTPPPPTRPRPARMLRALAPAPVATAVAAGDDGHRHDHVQTSDHHPHEHSAPASAAIVSVPVSMPADEPEHDHATIGRHHHGRNADDVVYVEDPAAPSPEAITRPTGFDNFWTILPAPVSLAAVPADAELRSTPALRRPSHAAGVPDRPPRG